MRMALDLGLNQALEKLAEDPEHENGHPEEEERDLGTISSVG